MAKIWFATPDGGEKAYALDKHRRLRIGRDPGNDVVLKDPRVSRRHAEVVFERGFFVLHDLASANGTWIDGKKVRIAPLTDGAALRLGNTLARFSEELMLEEGLGGGGTVSLASADERRQPSPAITMPNEIGPMVDPLKTEEEPPFELEPPPADDDGLQLTADLQLVDEQKPDPPASSEPTDDTTGSRSANVRDHPKGKFKESLYVVTSHPAEGDLAVIHDASETPLFYFRRPIHLVGCIASVVGGLVMVAGIGAVTILYLEQRLVPAALAGGLTLLFTLLILLIIPRTTFFLFEDAAMSLLSMVVRQESRFSFPALRFSIRMSDGETIGGMTRSAISRIGRHRWWLLDAAERKLGYAMHASLGRAMLQNIAGTFFGTLRTHFNIFYAGRPVGRIIRTTGARTRSTLDLSDDPKLLLDRRLALALAVVIDGVETR